MSFTATLQWDVRTTGNDGNGGAFDATSGVPGTDYSQQDVAQVTYTDLVIGTPNTTLTSAGNPFTAAHVGNVIKIAAGTGFTLQRVQILSVAGGVATVDKACGTIGSTAGQGKLGGALATIQEFCTGNSLNTADYATCHIKAGTYTLTTGILLGVNWPGLGMKFIGYGTAHNDGGTRPLVTTATNSVKIFAWIHNNGRDGVRAFGTSINPGFVFRHSVISNNVGVGINLAAGYLARVINCSVANNTGDGIDIQYPQDLEIENSIVYGNGGIGINSNSTGAATTSMMQPVTSDYNAYGANVGGNFHFYSAGPHDVALTVSPFTSATNFGLNSAAGGGAACKGAGFPGAFPGGLTTGSLDIGGAQAASGGGSGGGAYTFIE